MTEILGKSSGAPGAKENAAAWTKTLDWWRDAMEKEGVKIRAIADYFLPQQFNTLKVKGLGPDGFVEAMTERWRFGRPSPARLQVDRRRCALKPGVDDDRVKDILRDAYDNIATKGNISIEPGVTTKDTMADRYNRRRVFEWTSDTAYFDFANTFGNGADNLGEAFSRHLHQMSLDLGTARILGRRSRQDGQDPDAVRREERHQPGPEARPRQALLPLERPGPRRGQRHLGQHRPGGALVAVIRPVGRRRAVVALRLRLPALDRLVQRPLLNPGDGPLPRGRRFARRA